MSDFRDRAQSISRRSSIIVRSKADRKNNAVLTSSERAQGILKQLKSSNVWQTADMKIFHEVSE